MNPFSERFPQAFEEWKAAGGIENNFRAHALALGLATPLPEDLTFMHEHTQGAIAQEKDVLARYNATYPHPAPISPATGRAADISHLTGEIDKVFCDKLTSLSVDLVIVGLQNIYLARKQLATLRNFNFRTQAYIWPCNKDLDTYVPEVASVMQDFSMGYLWIDVENSEANVRQAIARFTPYPTFQVGIYTSEYMWKRWMNSTTYYSHLPLWYAKYDYAPDMTTFTPFAGWTRPTMKQYDARQPRYDLDCYDPDLLK